MSLEKSILHSMVAYPESIEEFLSKTPQKCFSKQGLELLHIILRLHEGNTLSLHTIELHIDAQMRESEYYLDFLSAEINPNYPLLAQSFVNVYLLSTQKDIAQKLLSASLNNQLLDLSSFDKDMCVNTLEYRTLKEWLIYYESKPKIPKIKTGISFLDNCFDGGLELGQLLLISGDPEAGKTMLGVQILENIAKTHSTCFFSFEFTIEQYLKIAAKKRLNQNNIYLINDGYDIHEVAHHIKTLYKQGVKVFLIDSQMRLISPAGRNMEEEESLKFSLLAKLCHSLGIIVMMIVQTSKGDRDNPMGSKKGGHESSITIRIERNAPRKDDITQQGKEFDENTRTIIVKKNKQTGKHFKEQVSFNPQTLSFSEMNEHIERSITYEELMGHFA